MNTTVDISSNKVLPKLMHVMGEEGRRDLYSVGANELAETISRHIRAYSGSKHATARRFGAPATGHYTKGTAAISTSADADGGTVTIPIPGISRAFDDVTITPTRASALTIPLESGGSTVYGRTVTELRAMGWNIFRGKGKAADILFGSDDTETKAMFVLRKSVKLERDPTLLPSKPDMAKSACNAMLKHVMDVVKRARNERKTA